MPEAGEIVRWISHLADVVANDRSEAARRLYQAGLDLCRAPLEAWQADPGFRELIVTRGGSPWTVVGIAVTPENFGRIHTANGSPPLADVPPDQDAMEFELHFSDHIDLDVLTTRDPEAGGAIARFLRKFGEGIQQIEVNVTSVDRATEILHTRFGLEPIYAATRIGADGTRVNFILVPAKNAKVLIELVEAKPADN